MVEYAVAKQLIVYPFTDSSQTASLVARIRMYSKYHTPDDTTWVFSVSVHRISYL